jgi:hypothetical protein
MKLNPVFATAAVAACLGGCASMTPTREIVQGYAVFDITAAEGVSMSRLSDAVKSALQANMSKVQLVNGLPPSPLPEKAPRFQLVSPFKGSGLGALAAASGQAVQVPACEGAVLTANGVDSSMGGYGERTTFFVCVMPYRGGYALNVHTTFSKVSGGFSASALGTAMARSVVGDSSQFIPRTIGQIVDAVRATGSSVSLKEAYP